MEIRLDHCVIRVSDRRRSKRQLARAHLVRLKRDWDTLRRAGASFDRSALRAVFHVEEAARKPPLIAAGLPD